MQGERHYWSYEQKITIKGLLVGKRQWRKIVNYWIGHDIYLMEDSLIESEIQYKLIQAKGHV